LKWIGTSVKFKNPPSRGCEKLKIQAFKTLLLFGHAPGSLWESHEDPKNHEGYHFDFVILRVPSWLCVFVVKFNGHYL
jgi:hypothetical protein